MTAAVRFTLRGWHVLVMLLTFFGAVIAVNAAFVVLALNSFPGEDVPHSYTQGLEYNETLAERQAQALLGWQANAALSASADGAVLEVVLRTHDGAPIEDAAVTGELEWPAAARRDRALSFQHASGGRYVAELGALEQGRWRLRAHAENDQGERDFESELTWRSR